ncbi:MAG: type VI secretion system accessory protein TagJ [Syntrophobacteraceae bacterium]|nr:type VI secretion system accessory protein TagJ [Syntrophobacteraceae bacterium]
MHAEQLVREGKFPEALEELKEYVRKEPDNSGYRTFLFQLLALVGDWQRALNQLNVLGDLEAALWPMVHIYKEAIQCEYLRKEVFAGRRQPVLLGEPPGWIALLLESMRLMGEGRFEAAVSLRNQAFEQAPQSSGTIDGQSFQWIADADSSLGPVLEVIVNAKYYWAPFQQISGIVIAEPKDLRDKVWLPAEFTWTNGGRAQGLIPARYAGSENSQDPMIAIGRKTEWIALNGGVYKGLGQRMLATDRDEYALLDIRQIRIG